MVTKYQHFGPDGHLLGSESYYLRLRYKPMGAQDGWADQFTCLELQLQVDDRPSVAVPELDGMTYTFNPAATGVDERSPLWGLPQGRFKSLTDGLGNLLTFSSRYAAYVSLIDFHSINDVFTKPMPFGNGIQNLKNVGQKVVHPASFMKAEVKFGTEVKSGSTYQNGEVTLELKGVGLVDGAPCAIVTYDAGTGTLRMVTVDLAGQESITNGISQYKGDIFIDLATRWIRKATLDEYGTMEISTEGSPSKVELTARHIQSHMDVQG